LKTVFHSDFKTLLDAARRGDSRARERLLERYYPTVERMAHRALLGETPYRRLGLMSLFSTGDIVQETCRAVLRDIDGFVGETESSFVCYLTAVVHHRLHDMLRFHNRARRDRSRVVGAEAAEGERSPAREPVDLAQRSEETSLFLGALERLGAGDRHLVIGRLEHRATFQELADELRLPSAEAARKAFCRAHARLLLALRRVGLDRSATTALGSVGV
jgi:RNA polymerase sigma factor (sigma-70 family)